MLAGHCIQLHHAPAVRPTY